MLLVAMLPTAAAASRLPLTAKRLALAAVAFCTNATPLAWAVTAPLFDWLFTRAAVASPIVVAGF